MVTIINKAMFHQCFIIAISWIGSVSLQYINTGGTDTNVFFDSLDGQQNAAPYTIYNSPTTRNAFETLQSDPVNEPFFQRSDEISEIQRKRRKSEQKSEDRDKQWARNMVDAEQDINIQATNPSNQYFLDITGTDEENSTANEILDPVEKKYFSPWGGKRDKPSIEHMWTWKRSSNVREPSMPKRVRFSPWGGKRSGQMVYKPGSKSSKIIFSTSVPELTQIVSNSLPKRLTFGGFHFIPIFDKRHPLQILALSTNPADRTIRDTMPFKSFLEVLPKLFKPGHPYLDVNLKKDGKRKVKFSAWGGKRSPPIIGPIWTPTTEDIKDSTLDTILLLRDLQDNDKIDQIQNEMSKLS